MGYAVFNDEGMVRDDFASPDAAAAWLRQDPEYSDDSECYVAEVCPEHNDEDKDACDCNAQDDSEDNGRKANAE